MAAPCPYSKTPKYQEKTTMDEQINRIQTLYQRLRQEADKVIVGLEEPFELLIVALLTGGHVLLEGVPGTAKTLMAKTVSHLVQAQFTRIQFTPDLMPSDILGTSVFDISSGQFYLKKGPIFTQLLLADEINRAPAKTQSALLEAMEERQVNLEGERHQLASPFMVIATQNPIEYEGTYPLPEAQLDRFLFKVLVPYSPLDVEMEVLRRYHQGFNAHDLAAAGLQAVLPADGVAQIQRIIQQVIVEEGILTYIAQVTAASRQSPDLSLGASTRAATHVLLAAKTYAAIQGRNFVTPDDVKVIVPPVFRHRILLKPEAEIEGLDADAVIQRILGRVEVPR
jgi:MoxR-like ATPase